MTEDNTARPAGRTWVWPTAVVGILLGSIVICAVTVVLALSDSNFAVEDDYYGRALAWDESRESEARVESLRWTIGVTLTGREPPLDRRRLLVEIRGDDGAPVEVAGLRANLFHRARSEDRHEIVLAPVGDARYSATVIGGMPGLWRLRLSSEAHGVLLIDDIVSADAVGGTPAPGGGS